MVLGKNCRGCICQFCNTCKYDEKKCTSCLDHDYPRWARFECTKFKVKPGEEDGYLLRDTTANE